MIIAFDKNNHYVPEWNENKALPPEEQLVVTWRYPSVQEREEICTLEHITADSDKVGVKINRPKIVRYMVPAIKGLNVNGKDITTGSALIDTEGLTALFDELASFLIDKVNGYNKKK